MGRGLIMISWFRSSTNRLADFLPKRESPSKKTENVEPVIFQCISRDTTNCTGKLRKIDKRPRDSSAGIAPQALRVVLQAENHR